jgi:hypothetical protein
MHVMCLHTSSVRLLTCNTLLLLLITLSPNKQTKWIMDAWVALTYQFTRIRAVAWFFSDELNKVLLHSLLSVYDHSSLYISYYCYTSSAQSLCAYLLLQL